MNTIPFSLAFGHEPTNVIKRQRQINQIKDAFTGNNPLTYAYIITGVRGSGKTVLLSGICKEFKNSDDWIVVELNPNRDMLESFAAKLYEKCRIKYRFLNKEISFSFHGLTINLTGHNPVFDVESLLERMLGILNKHNKKVLIAIDEVSNSKSVKTFIQSFQILNRQNASLFLIMTGLYSNVKNLQNDKTLTFLYRAPKIDIEPLDLIKVKNSYMDLLGVQAAEAIEYAKLTAGYAFGFQTLGYLLYENKNVFSDKLIEKYDEYLKEYVYDKIWSEMSPTYQSILKALAKNDSGDVEQIYKAIGMKKSTFSSFRDNLIKNGIITSIGWGFVKFTLPRFKEYIFSLAQFE